MLAPSSRNLFPRVDRRCRMGVRYGYADRANWISRRNLDVIKALVHGEESGICLWP